MGLVVERFTGGNTEIDNMGLCTFDKNITLTFSPAHQPSSSGIAERIVVMLKTTVRRLFRQAHLDHPWWSYACGFARHMMREKVLGRAWTWPLFGQWVGIWTTTMTSHPWTAEAQ